MVLRDTDARVRKDIILSIAIEQYINCVTPVSSAFIAEKYPGAISSATIRNVLAELENDGYLTHPHTSAGRIPTQEGYRYYVDHLMQEIHLLEEEKHKINEEYHTQTRELEALLEKTSEVLSEVTHYTSIISVDGWNTKLICKGTSHVVAYPDYEDIHKIKAILQALEEKERMLEIINQSLQKRVEVFIGQEIAFNQIDNCSLVVATYKLNKGPSGRLAILGPTRMNYKRVVSTLEYLTELMEKSF